MASLKLPKLLHAVKIWHLMITLTVVIVFIFFLIHYSISKLDGENDDMPVHVENTLHSENSFQSRKIKAHIDELIKIKTSVNNELRELESKRRILQTQISKYHTDLEKTRSEKEIIEKEIKMTLLTLEQFKLERDEMHQKFAPLLKAPMQMFVKDDNSVNNAISIPAHPGNCRMHNCFDYSTCSVLSGFPMYIYHRHHLTELGSLEPFIDQSVWDVLDSSVYKTYDPKTACVFIVIVGQRDHPKDYTPDMIEKALYSLPYWRGDGRNHILVNVQRRPGGGDIFSGVNTGRAIIAQTAFLDTIFRRDYDIIIPPSIGKASGELWEDLPPISPIRRKHFVSFVGSFKGNLPNKEELVKPLELTDQIIEQHKNIVDKENNEVDLNTNVKSDLNYNYQNRNLLSVQTIDSQLDFDVSFVKHIKQWGSNADSGVVCQFSCDSPIEGAINREWTLCGTAGERRDLLEQSTFSLIVAPVNTSYISTSVLQIRLFESLKHGSVPVILGDYVELPFSGLLDWQKAVILLPKARVTEVNFLLRTFTDNDIAFFRQRGRLFYESYFGSTHNIMKTIIATVRTRLNIPASPISDVDSPSVFNSSFSIHKLEGPEPNPETDEVLGPLEPPLASTFFKQNYTKYLSFEHYQHYGDPFHMFPAIPFEKTLPSESKFLGKTFLK